MTLEEFFAKLPRDGWRITPVGHLRRGDHRQITSCCPITAVHPASPSAGEWKLAAWELGLDIELAQDIVDAADKHKSIRYAPALRARLLAHCGLDEPS